jgi:hypothetical protein
MGKIGIRNETVAIMTHDSMTCELAKELIIFIFVLFNIQSIGLY